MRAIGASNYTAPRLALGARRRARRQRPAALRDAAAALQPGRSAPPTRPSSSRSASSSGLGVINYYALASGFSPASTAAAPTSARASAAAAPASILNERGLRGPGGARRRRRHRRRDARRRSRSPGRSPGRASPRRSPARARRRSSTSWSAARALPLDTPSIELIDRASQRRAGMTQQRRAEPLSLTQVLRLRRRDRHAVDGHPPRLRPLAAADHRSSAAGAARPSPSRSRCRTSPGASPGRSTGALADRWGAFRVLIVGSAALRRGPGGHGPGDDRARLPRRRRPA